MWTAVAARPLLHAACGDATLSPWDRIPGLGSPDRYHVNVHSFLGAFILCKCDVYFMEYVLECLPSRAVNIYFTFSSSRLLGRDRLSCCALCAPTHRASSFVAQILGGQFESDHGYGTCP